jgi:hypothetical protein
LENGSATAQPIQGADTVFLLENIVVEANVIVQYHVANTVQLFINALYANSMDSRKLLVPPRLTLGLGNEYFCRPQPSKRQKQLKELSGKQLSLLTPDS